jgi:hypothetical protein
MSSRACPKTPTLAFLTTEVRGDGGGVFSDRMNRIFRIPVDVITIFEARTCTPTILSKKNDSTIL